MSERRPEAQINPAAAILKSLSAGKINLYDFPSAPPFKFSYFESQPFFWMQPLVNSSHLVAAGAGAARYTLGSCWWKRMHVRRNRHCTDPWAGRSELASAQGMSDAAFDVDAAASGEEEDPGPGRWSRHGSAAICIRLARHLSCLFDSCLIYAVSSVSWIWRCAFLRSDNAFYRRLRVFLYTEWCDAPRPVLSVCSEYYRRSVCLGCAKCRRPSRYSIHPQ
ncbi:hypothetical protein B0H11DRAFT_1381625 [Mycena galericulata]|nr:hypothetical protein B0H11DRAFT_1381625 [Mycena galericulata]